jgi:hypothetical protein
MFMATLTLIRHYVLGLLAPTLGTLYLRLEDRKQNDLARLATTLEPNEASGLLIREGTYDLSVTYSPKFRRNLPLIDVPKRLGIRIHAGNTIDDTSGCILVGCHSANNTLYHSRISLNYILDVIKEYKITKITIINHESIS